LGEAWRRGLEGKAETLGSTFPKRGITRVGGGLRFVTCKKNPVRNSTLVRPRSA